MIKLRIALLAMDWVNKLYFSINKTNVNVLFDANNETIVSSTATSINIYHLIHYILSRLGMHSILFFIFYKGELGRHSTAGTALPA